MLNEFIETLAQKLIDVFGEDTIVYSENIPQGLKTACFYIRSINHSQKSMTKGRRKISQFDIMYIPVEGSLDTEQEINSILTELVDKMTNLEINGKVFKATEIRAEKVDGVLHYFVNFDFNTLYRKERAMETLELKEVDVNGIS